MKKQRAFIIDDEYWARINLKDKLKDFQEIEIIGEADSIKDAEKGIRSLNPDVLFLDIQLGDGTGFDLLNDIAFTGKVIFVTAFDEYALRAFDINALDYLMKPISDESLERAISRLEENHSGPEAGSKAKLRDDDRIMVVVKDSLYFILVNTIISISASRDYSEIYTVNNKKFLTTRSMNEWEERLPEQTFCRVHRSHIVNFEHIEKSVKYSSNTALIYIKGLEEPLKLSRSYYKKVKDRYM